MPPRKGQGRKQVIERLQDAAAAVVQRMSGGRPGVGRSAGDDVLATGSMGTDSVEVPAEQVGQQGGEPVHIDTSQRPASWLEPAPAQWASRHRYAIGTSLTGILLLALTYQATTANQMCRHADARAKKLEDIVAQQLIASNSSYLAYTDQLQNTVALLADYQLMARKADNYAQSIDNKLQAFVKEHQANLQTTKSLQLQLHELQGLIVKQQATDEPNITLPPPVLTAAHAQLEAHTATAIDKSLRRRLHSALHKLFHPFTPTPVLPSARLTYTQLINRHLASTNMNMLHTPVPPCFLQLIPKPGLQPSITFVFEHPTTRTTSITFVQDARHLDNATSHVIRLPSKAHVSAQTTSSDWITVAVVDMTDLAEATGGMRAVQLPSNVSSQTLTRVRVAFDPNSDMGSSDKKSEKIICAPAVLFHTSP